MTTVNALGKPCPIPVVEAKKVLADGGTEGVLVKVDNIEAVQNLEKMAKGYGYDFSYASVAEDSFEVTVRKIAAPSVAADTETKQADTIIRDALDIAVADIAVVIGKDAMGSGSEELGKILVKGFIYSLSELPAPPKYMIFMNSGAFLTADGSNTVEDIKNMERKGTQVFTCGTCSAHFGLKDKLAVGSISDMYGITEKLVSVKSVINI